MPPPEPLAEPPAEIAAPRARAGVERDPRGMAVPVSKRTPR